MLEYINIDKIKNKVKEITNGTPQKDISEKGRKIGRLLKQVGLTNKSYKKLVDVFSEVIGEPVELIDCSKNSRIGTMLVPLKSGDSDNYKIGEPVLVDTNSSRILKMSGTPGNNLTIGEGYTRKATNEEIDGFFDCFDFICGKAYILSFIKYL